jgi:integrase
MIYKPKGRKRYRVKFRFQGKLIHRSTTATTYKTAKGIEATIRSELEKGNWGILEKKPCPSLEDFFKKDFLPFIEAEHKDKPATLTYYSYGAKGIQSCSFVKLPIDEITDQQAKEYAAQNKHQSPSTVNMALRTLRRALNLAFEWGVMDRPSKIRLVKGEKQRERVLTETERAAYLKACRQPWKDIATVILGTGMRPGEVHKMRWENVMLQEERGLFSILEGKSKAARRALPMVPEVLGMMQRRHKEQGCPSEGWVFPADTESGHTEEDALKRSHQDALEESKVAAFPPYTMRHTALTDLGTLGCDPFTLAKIAGHSSIVMTQRYCHPQADAIERAFNLKQNQKLVTAYGHQEKQPEKEENSELVNTAESRA